MTERLGQGRPDLFRKELQSILRVIIWLALPAVVIVFLCRGYLVFFIKNGGESTIAAILGVLAIAILFRSVYQIASRSFYAQQDTKTPLYISIFTIGLNIVLAVILGQPGTLGVVGLAIAQSIVSFVEVAILFSIMQYRIRGIFTMEFGHAVWKMLLATAAMFVATYIAVQFFPLRSSDQSMFNVLPKFFAICVLSGIIYTLVSRRMRLQEAAPIIDRVERLVFSQFKPPRGE